MTQKKTRPANQPVLKGRASYPHLFTPYAFNEGDEPKYSVTLLIPKDDATTLKRVEVAIDAAKKAGIEKKTWGKGAPANLTTPLHDGDEEKPDDPIYANHYYISMSSRRAPQVVLGKLGADGKPITAEDNVSELGVYGGCYIAASCTFSGYNVAGNKGIACYLRNVQKVDDGEPFDGSTTAADDFDFEEFSDEDLYGIL